MRKVLYYFFSIGFLLAFFGFLEIQQLKGSDIKFSDMAYLKKIILKQRPITPFDDIDKRNSIRKSNLMEIAFALNCYKKDYGFFPDLLDVCGSLTGTGIFSSDARANPIYPEYMENPLSDPINNSSFNYVRIGNKDRFVLFTKLEGKNDGKNIYYCIDSITNVPAVIDFNPSQKLACN